MTGKTRPVLILLSGLLCDEQIWEDVRRKLTAIADVRVISFPGFSSIESMAERVLESAPARFALAGHSMGGRVALEVFRRAPDRLSGLALLNTGVHPPAPHEPTSRGRLIELAHTAGMIALAKQWLPPLLGREYSTDDPLTRRLTSMIERATPEGFAAQVEALLRRPDAQMILPTVRVPVLLLSARGDTWSPPHQHAAMHEMCLASQFVIIDDAGHMSPAEDPEAVAFALMKWLARVSDVEESDRLSDLEHLLIVTACTQKIHQYARMTDARAWGALSSLFSSDGVLFRPSDPDTPIQGRSAILATLNSLPIRVSRHCVTNIEVNVECRTRAFAVSSVALYTGEGTDGVATIESTFVGRFRDHFVKSGEQWLFAERCGRVLMRGSAATR